MRVINKTKMAWWVVIALPILVLAVHIYYYCVDIPFWDEWGFVICLERFYKGQLSIADLFAQHCEHRLFFPRLIMLGLAWLTGWSIGAELAVIFLLALGLCGALFLTLKRTWQQMDRSDSRYLLYAFISMIVFSLAQSENWLMGLQISLVLSVLAGVLVIVCLTTRSFSWWGFAGAMFAAIVASYSFGTGLLAWFVGLPLLWPWSFCSSSKGVVVKQQQLLLAASIWLMVGIACISGYFYGYTKPVNHPPVYFLLYHPLDYLFYVLAFFGNPISSSWLSPLFGFGSFVLPATCLYWLKKEGFRDWRALRPFWGLSGYAVGCSLVIGVGRVGFGPYQALESRYITMANLHWITVIFLLYLVAEKYWSKLQDAGLKSDALEGAKFAVNKRQVLGLTTKQRQRFLVVIVTLSVIATGFCSNSFQAHDSFAEEYTVRSLPYEILLSGNECPPKLLRRLYPSAQDAALWLEVLKKYHLSIFRCQNLGPDKGM